MHELMKWQPSGDKQHTMQHSMRVNSSMNLLACSQSSAGQAPSLKNPVLLGHTSSTGLKQHLLARVEQLSRDNSNLKEANSKLQEAYDHLSGVNAQLMAANAKLANEKHIAEFLHAQEERRLMDSLEESAAQTQEVFDLRAQLVAQREENLQMQERLQSKADLCAAGLHFTPGAPISRNYVRRHTCLGIMGQEFMVGGCSLSEQNLDGSCTPAPMWCDDFIGGSYQALGLCTLAEDTAHPYCSNKSMFNLVAGKKYSSRGSKQLSRATLQGSTAFSRHPSTKRPRRATWCGSVGKPSTMIPMQDPFLKDPVLKTRLSAKGNAGYYSRCGDNVAAGRVHGPLGRAMNIAHGDLECGFHGR